MKASVGFSVIFVFCTTVENPAQATTKFNSSNTPGSGLVPLLLDGVVLNLVEQIFSIGNYTGEENSGNNLGSLIKRVIINPARPIMDFISWFMGPLERLFNTERGKLLEKIVEVAWVTPTKETADFIGVHGKLVFPGTKWCGAGNTASDPHELGIFKGTDECCREHDNCDDHIAGGDTQHGLTNSGLFTKSHCKCDDKFYKCLKKVGKFPSTLIGYKFFNILRFQCFKEEYPAKCVKMWLIPRRCTKYELDTTAPKLWQWFDARPFLKNSEWFNNGITNTLG